MLNKLKELFTIKPKLNTFKCSCCGNNYNEWPALVYNTPVYYSDLSDSDKIDIAELSSDFCVIKNKDQTDRFIRGVLKIPIKDSCRYLEYGIWVSLSESSFEDYKTNYNNDDKAGRYFGWISNNIEGYFSTVSVASDVYLQPNGFRPNIVPHRDNNHLLVQDYYNGISLSEAERRVNTVVKNSNN